MELNAEQIKNNFHNCLIGECHLCTYYTRKDCKHQLMSKVVALINEQERKIKELTEGKYDIECSYNSLKKDNERLHASCTELERKCASLNDEIESLKDSNEHLAVFLSEAKANTVRKMQERLIKEAYPFPCAIGVEYAVPIYKIYQIAEEMM